MRLLGLVLVLAAALAVPAAASAQTELQLPSTDPRLDWLDDDAVGNKAVAVDGEVGDPELRRTLQILEIRRKMLTAHQVLAWTAAFSIIAAEVVGMINRVALQGGTIHRSKMEPMLGLHRGLAGVALTSYWGAGVLAWTMPSPSARREHKGINNWGDTRDTHIILSIIHTISMGIVTATGILQANVLPAEHWEPLMVTHTTAGFVAAGFVLSAAVVIARM
ncbi:MAG: hypothetical protein GY898_05910 [Proteobacteria bacterium]|nr:hypothetical protein [Pseudomonadota bacterium]